MSKLLTVLALGLFACAGAQAADNLTQQEKMRACSKGAAGKKGDERRQFMSACLKKGSDVAALTGGKAGAQGAKRPSTKPAQAGS